MHSDLNLNTVTLWAMWKTTVIYMQDWNGCSSLEQDNGSNGDRISITLTDKRDGNTYTVAKLKDGKCWMTQNLRLQNYTLKPEDSDVNNTFFLPRSESSQYQAECNQSTSPLTFSFSWPENIDTFGAYYTWYTATARKTTLSANQNATESICPRGWKLPNSSEGQNLLSKYSCSAVENSPVNFVRSGQFCKVGYTPSMHGYGYSSVYYTSTSNGGFSAQSIVVFRRSNSSSCEYYQVTSWNDANSAEPIRCLSRNQ